MKDKKYIDPRVTSYLAGYGINRNIDWDDKREAWKYPARYLEVCKEEEVARYVKLLPLVVPGLVVVDSVWDEKPFRRRGYIWFTWNSKAMWKRYEEVFEEFGVADVRLAYTECSGKIRPRNGQLRLPGIIDQEARAIVSSSSRNLNFFSSWTPYGLQLMDTGFAHRIMNPNKGGPDAVPFKEQRCVVGDEWWLVGSRGDSLEIMELEIQASPLDSKTQENLLSNLRNYREDALLLS